MSDDRLESLLTLYMLTGDLGLVVDAIWALEPVDEDAQLRLYRNFGRQFLVGQPL